MFPLYLIIDASIIFGQCPSLSLHFNVSLTIRFSKNVTFGKSVTSLWNCSISWTVFFQNWHMKFSNFSRHILPDSIHSAMRIGPKTFYSNFGLSVIAPPNSQVISINVFQEKCRFIPGDQLNRNFNFQASKARLFGRNFFVLSSYPLQRLVPLAPKFEASPQNSLRSCVWHVQLWGSVSRLICVDCERKPLDLCASCSDWSSRGTFRCNQPHQTTYTDIFVGGSHPDTIR
jgi:hypothetical protein